jgi:hypothetical protein
MRGSSSSRRPLQIIDELIPLTPELALLKVNARHGFANFAQSVEGVGTAAPSCLQGGYRVGGALRSSSRRVAQRETRRALLVLLPLRSSASSTRFASTGSLLRWASPLSGVAYRGYSSIACGS